MLILNAARRNLPMFRRTDHNFNLLIKIDVVLDDIFIAIPSSISFPFLRSLGTPPPSVLHRFTMALPAVKTAYDCADFERTVLPYFSQLNGLPGRLIEAGADLDSLKEVYLSTNPFITALAFTLSLVPVFLLVSEITKNYSQVDRLWSILPSILNAHFSAWSHLAGLDTERVDTVLAFSVLWSVSSSYHSVYCPLDGLKPPVSRSIFTNTVPFRFDLRSTTGEKVATRLVRRTIAGGSFAPK